MKTNILAAAAGLSDQDLLARLDGLASSEREASAELVAHLAALDARPAAYAALGFGSLFTYCTQALRLSEDAACNRIEAARACRRFPVILDLLALGSLTLTSVRLLGRHLTPENHEAVLTRASGRTRQEIEVLLAELAPRPDVRSCVRKLPVPEHPAFAVNPASSALAASSEPTEKASPASPSEALSLAASVPAVAASAALAPTPRPIVLATAPGRYRVQFTIGSQTHEKLRRLQALLRREIPDGDPGAIFDRALTLLLDRVERTKLAASTRPRARTSIRPGTDRKASALPSRYLPREVKRTVWQRDDGQCAFLSPTGHRCSERTFLEFHHIQAFAKHGPATIANISLRCRRHNQYEAERTFGPHARRSVNRGSGDNERIGPE